MPRSERIPPGALANDDRTAQPETALRPSRAFAAQMRIQRERKGWTQKQLAERLDELGFPVHQTTIGKWEASERKLSLDEALAICVALDVAPASMLAGAFLGTHPDHPILALSAETPPVSARALRAWIRGQKALWDQDEKRYHTEVGPDEWRTQRRPGVIELLRNVQELVEAWADDDRQLAAELTEAITDELGRQQRSLDRELARRAQLVS